MSWFNHSSKFLGVWPGVLAAGWLLSAPAPAQILMSGGGYAQNFDALASSGSALGWTNNETLPGWYAAKGSAAATTYSASAGTSGTGGIYSFGTNGVNAAADRALGSVASASTAYACGVRFTNDTALAATNLTVAFTGEQWRNANGAGAVTNRLAFSFQIASAPLTNADAANLQTWTAVAGLDFNSPVVNVGGSGTALDGNAAANRQGFSHLVLGGVTVPPGQEIFLRWRDLDDAGGDAGMAIDDVAVSFELAASAPPVSTGTNTSVTLMTYNVKGNGTTDWSTNTAQAQAIGRQLVYLNADVITFNEIPLTNSWQMTNWVTAFMPGYHLAANSGTDGFIRSVIASRFPIIRSQSWLDGADLKPFGYTNASSSAADNFTRDLFEAEINVPNWPQPLHVFTTHLKASGTGTNYADSVAKRAAEAAAITNFLATSFFALYPGQPFTLSGDMNETDTNALAIQRLISLPTALRLTNPTNPFTGSLHTYSSASPNGRLDYIFPGALLASNIMSSQVFRTGQLNPVPPGLNGNDDVVASDHLPVLLTFANPFNTPFKLLAITRTSSSVTLQWESATNRVYDVEASLDLTAWTPLAEHLFATGSNYYFTTNHVSRPWQFYRVRRVP